jgi:hypothetical protein
MKTRAVILSLVLALGAGHADAKKSKVKEAETANPAADTPSAIELGALPEAAIPKGECGMVLWTLDEQRPQPVFRYVAGKSADIVLAGERETLSRTDASGATGFGISEQQTFSREGVLVRVIARFSLGFDAGTYLERGVISIETADGWRTVVPAAGIAGCRAA